MSSGAAVTLQPYIGAEIPSLAEALQTSIAAKTGQTIPFEVIATWLSTYVNDNAVQHFSLSYTKPDFENIKVQFIARVRQTKAWKDVIQAGWAETLSEFFAAICDYGQTSILRAYQESGVEARLSSSIYMQMRSLGVHIDRVIPAQVKVNLWGVGLTNQTIPELSEFSIGSYTFFNRDPIQFNNNVDPSTALTATLYQGEIRTESYLSRGVPFQYFEIGDENSNISNIDLYCFTGDGDIYEASSDGLWHHGSDEKIFYQNMAPSGTVEALFGNNVYGLIPPINTVLNFIYASSLGSVANNASTGLNVSLTSINENVPHRIRNTDQQTIDEQVDFLVASVNGITASAIMSGDDLKDKEFYRAVGPSIRASNGRIVTRSDHYAQGLRYPGIGDVLFQPQKELAPHDRRFTNVIGVTVLMRNGILMTSAEWDLYISYLQTMEIWSRGIEFLRIDPTPRYFDIAADVYMTNDSDTTNVNAYLRYIFNNFFQIQRGSLGKSVYGSDIEDNLKFNYGDMKVDFVRNISPNPAVDTILGKTEYPVLRSFVPTVQYSGRGARFVPPRQVY
jgi:hypothetical protein